MGATGPHTAKARAAALPDGRRAAALLAAGVAAALTAAVAGPATAGAVPPALQRGVVSAPTATAAAEAVRAAGGRVLEVLGLADAVVADLPARAVLPVGISVVPDAPLRLATGGQPPAAAPTSTLRATLGLPASGNEGTGTTVAVVDTGIADVPDLAGKVVARFDVTGEGGGDPMGHGTFIAGLVAGSGAASGGTHRGVAPGARLVDVKVAHADGSTSLVDVLRGLELLAKEGPRHGVDVVNLSLSSGSTLPWQLDPLTTALAGLWRRGVTVVVPAGNEGTKGITSPGVSPVLLTVGSVDEAGTASRGDDVVPAWSSRGPAPQGVAKPEIAAPGQSLVSLRAPGSDADSRNPQSRVGPHYFVGSGTSFSAAVVSGAAAAVLAVRPGLGPDGVKALLAGTAYRAPGLTEPTAAGAGGIDLRAALAAAPDTRGGRSASGSAARGAVPGPADRWLALVDAVDQDDPAAAARAWARLSPAARAWAEQEWAELDVAARAWAARAWAARAWAGADATETGDDGAPTARAWAARAWAARAWAARAWAARAWS